MGMDYGTQLCEVLLTADLNHLSSRQHLPHPPTASPLRQHMPRVSLPCPVLCYEELLDAQLDTLAAGGFAWTDVAEIAACGLCYTSGTTGNPKGVLYSHRSNVLHALVLVQPDSW